MIMDTQIKNIIFDWGGVLLDLDFEGCLQRFEKAGATEIRNLVTGKNEAGFFHQYECGMISTPQFREEIRRLTGNGLLTDDEVDAIWNSELLSIPEEKLRLLMELSQKYRIYLLSNTNELHWNSASGRAFQYGNTDVKEYFTQIFLSYEMKLAKSDPEIFRAVMNAAGLRPEETVFIDDAKVNCEAAVSTGMHAMHYIPGEDLALLFQ